jgi:hypothetical protein
MAASTSLDPGLRSLRARVAAFARAAQYDGRDVTAKARATFLASFLQRVDADQPGLPEAERQRRAHALRKAHFSRMAFESAKARRGHSPAHTQAPRDAAFGSVTVTIAEAADAR